MRITVDIDETSLREIQEATGERKISPAVKKVIAEYLDRRAREVFIDKVMQGQTDYALSNDELEAMLDFTPRHFGSD